MTCAGEHAAIVRTDVESQCVHLTFKSCYKPVLPQLKIYVGRPCQEFAVGSHKIGMITRGKEWPFFTIMVRITLRIFCDKQMPEVSAIICSLCLNT